MAISSNLKDRTSAVENDRLTLRFLTAPQDMDHSGSQVQAGRILEWIDRAGYACAVAWSTSYCVTAYVGNVHYDGTIGPGDVVEIDARIIHTGKSSIHVLVSVHARPLSGADYARAMHCILVFVAVDERGQPRPVRPWKPTTPDDAARQYLALERIPVRMRIKDAMLAEHYSQQGTAPRSLLRFVAGTDIANWAGNAHGGTVMRWIDEAAGTCAVLLSPQRPRAKYSGGIHFHSPIRIGQIIEVDARAILVSEQDIHISVLVRSAPPQHPEQLSLTTRCMMIFAAADGAPAPAPIPSRTAEDRRLATHGREIISMRSELTKISDNLIRTGGSY